MKKIIIALIAISLLLMSTGLVAAKGPTNVVAYTPLNDNAWWNSGQYIGPSIFGIGTETTIAQDDGTIVVGVIPEAEYDEVTGEYTGTCLMWKVNYNDPELFTLIKFWLNGSDPVTITYFDSEDVEIKIEEATEFIFFKGGYVDGVWQYTLQAYK